MLNNISTEVDGNRAPDVKLGNFIHGNSVDQSKYPENQNQQNSKLMNLDLERLKRDNQKLLETIEVLKIDNLKLGDIIKY